MTPDVLRSRSNTLVRSLRELARDAGRREQEGALIADGVRLLEEAISRGCDIDVALVSPRLERDERGRSLLAQLERRAGRVLRATDDVVESVVGAPRHQGAVARVRAVAASPAAVLAGTGPALLACGIQDPGNLGGLVRVVAAAGGAGLIASVGCADPWNPKAVRASAGAIFHLPVAPRADALDTLAAAAGVGRLRRAAVAAGGTPYRRADWRRPVLLVLGGEAAGVPPAVHRQVDETVTIPLARNVESLNVLSAATLLLFEAAHPPAPPPLPAARPSGDKTGTG